MEYLNYYHFLCITSASFQETVHKCLLRGPCWVRTRLLTLDNEVDVGNAGLVVGLEAAGVGSLVGYLHLLDVDGEVAVVAVCQRHALVKRPLIRPREQDVGAVQPGLVGHLLIDPTSGRTGGGETRYIRLRGVPIVTYRSTNG